MKVFLSWSGSLSHEVAQAFRSWLPSVIQSVEPFVSSEDIDKGSRWSADIAQELEDSNYGIIFVTNANLEEPWVSFEAGALAKVIDKSNVTPFLFNIKRSEVEGPLLQFQSAIYEKDEVFKILESINSKLDEGRLQDEQLKRAFNVWWPKLDDKLKELSDSAGELVEEPEEPKDPDSEILEELLELSRRQQRLLNDPEKLLPPEYIDYSIRISDNIEYEGSNDVIEFVESIHEDIIEVESHIEEIEVPSPRIEEAERMTSRIHSKVHELMELIGRVR